MAKLSELNTSTHVLLVSAQAAPNLLPALDPAMRPAEAVLLVSAKMQPRADALERVLQQAGVKTRRMEIANEHNFAALESTLLDVATSRDSQTVALNVTGGTKLMAVAAQEVFRSEGKPVFYVNVENDEVLVIGEKAASQPLRAKLKVHEMLRAHGYSVTTQEQPQISRELRDLTARLIDHVASAGRALGALNALARVARINKNLQAELSPAQQDSRSLGDIVALFADTGLLRQQGNALMFKNEEARFFANGGWLETHVYEVLQSLRSQHEALSDVAMGVRVGFADASSKTQGNDKNEIDVAFLYRNTLHLIECKTANLALPGSGGDDKATEAIYKMESLLKLGGLRTRGMVVDYRGQLSQSEANQKRAAEARIEIVSGAQLKDLKGFISRVWLTKGD